jgi:hypothetical protein
MTRLLLTTLSQTEWMTPAEIIKALPVAPSMFSLCNTLLQLTRKDNAPLRRRRLDGWKGHGSPPYEYIINEGYAFPRTQQVPDAELIDLGGDHSGHPAHHAVMSLLLPRLPE